MTNKIISSVIFTTSVVFWALANANPDNLLFLFVSASPVANIARVVLGAGMMLLSFRRVLSSKQARSFVQYLGFGLVAFGAYSMLTVGGAMYDYIKLLDVFIIAEAGIIFTTCALTTTIELRSTAEKEAARSATEAPALQRRAA